jgi:hypothetical protein
VVTYRQNNERLAREDQQELDDIAGWVNSGHNSMGVFKRCIHPTQNDHSTQAPPSLMTEHGITS